ncbi:hypothetical protein LMG23994_00369 [Cupriavidus pinatubonensis]|uniref:Uncharacterized protein n=1 Tax=Cupriavidus pinatubonensis TaxID=248026 RepID=A0ABM8WB88_9BURK|nr:hypothetical protein LMG23994_00369 [Cupriavidus pinatubonensis]
MTVISHSGQTSRQPYIAPPHAGTEAIEIRPFDAPLGAEVLGLDLSRPLSAEDFARSHRAHLDYQRAGRGVSRTQA